MTPSVKYFSFLKIKYNYQKNISSNETDIGERCDALTLMIVTKLETMN